MNWEPKIAAFEAKLHDTLVDAGYVVKEIRRIQVDPEGYDGYQIITDKGHATYIVGFPAGQFLRVVDLPPGFGA